MDKKFYNREQAKQFLEFLFKNSKKGFVEIRPIRQNKVLQQYFDISDGLDSVIEAISDVVGTFNVFVGIQLRDKESGKDSDIRYLSTFWADIDAKDFDGNKNLALQSLDNFSLRPSMVIDSGNGYHAYWILNDPIDLKKDSVRAEITKLSRLIHYVVKADSTYNLSRILRMAGTPNIKNPNGTNGSEISENPADWKMCSIHSLDYSITYNLNDVKKALEGVEIQADSYETVELDFDNCENRIKTLEDLENFVAKSILLRAEKLPAKFNGDFSSNDYWLAIKLYEAGLNDLEVLTAFKLFAEADWDAGNKVKRSGIEYLTKLTFPKVKAVLKNHTEIMDKLKNSQGSAKEKLIDDAMDNILKMHPVKQESELKQLQELLGGAKEISLTSLKKIMREKSTQKKLGKFFIQMPSGGYKFVPSAMGQYFIEKYDLINIVGNLYRYINGVFVNDGLEFIRKEIQLQLEENWKKSYADEVVTWIMDYCNIEIDDLPKNEYFINVRNGMLNILTDELLEHSPSYMSLVQLDVDYNPKAKCGRMDKFMAEVFPKDTISVIWEYMGYILLNNLNLKKFMLFVGDGDNGKSIWLSVIEQVLGEHNLSHEPLQMLANDKYSVSQLFGKIANINADLDEEAIKRTGTLKMLTGGDKVRGEQKYGHPFYFKNTAKLVFSANQLPTVTDYNEAYFNRLMIINCPNRFVGDNADPMLIDKLTTDEAKSYWLNNALEGARRLLENKKFTFSKTIEDNNMNYRFSADSVTEFIHTCCEVSEENFVTKDEIYNLYKNWCINNQRRAVSKNKFTRRAKMKENDLQEFYPSLEGEQILIKF